MEDILFSLPSYCSDCETWHQYHYWAYDDGHYSVCDSDGDHESIDQEDLPSQDEHDQRWREYAQWVLDTGTDPLDNFYVSGSHKVKERWQFKFWKSLTGPRLSAARRAGRIYEPHQLPDHVKSFLNLTSTNNLGDFSKWEDLEAAVSPQRVSPYIWFSAQLEQDQPRKEAIIARELRRAARKALAR